MKTRKDNLTELRTQNSELRTQNSEDNCILFVCSEIIAKTRWSKNEPADL